MRTSCESGASRARRSGAARGYAPVRPSVFLIGLGIRRLGDVHAGQGVLLDEIRGENIFGEPGEPWAENDPWAKDS